MDFFLRLGVKAMNVPDWIVLVAWMIGVIYGVVLMLLPPGLPWYVPSLFGGAHGVALRLLCNYFGEERR